MIEISGRIVNVLIYPRQDLAHIFVVTSSNEKYIAQVRMHVSDQYNINDLVTVTGTIAEERGYTFIINCTITK